MIEVVELGVEHENEYHEFIRLSETALIYATLDFSNFLETVVPGHSKCLLAIDEGEIVGALPYYISLGPYGSVINSLPWYGSYGGCLTATDNEDIVFHLLKRYKALANMDDVFAATLIMSPFQQNKFEYYKKLLKPDVLDQRIGQITKLPEHCGDLEQRLEMTFHQKTRNLVRKSRKQGFKYIVTNEDWAWQFLYETHVENLIAIMGNHKPQAHFKALKNMISSDMKNLLVTMDGQEPIAALLLLYFNKTVEYITPVIKHEYRSKQPLSFLIWHGMLDAVKNGYQFWNWGGTWLSQKSLHHFKSRWGATDYPYTYLTHCKENSLKTINGQTNEVMKAYPYSYIYPLHLLEG